MGLETCRKYELEIEILVVNSNRKNESMLEFWVDLKMLCELNGESMSEIWSGFGRGMMEG